MLCNADGALCFTEETMMPLAIAPTNINLRVLRVAADGKLKKYLETLGILTGGEITLLSQHSGDLLVCIKESRIALNRELAMKIFVKEV